MHLKEKINPLYHSFLKSLVELEIPDEQIATCKSCPICGSELSPYLNLKCCDYYPYLPNYLVGAILSAKSDSLTTGRVRLKEEMDKRIGVTPYGIFPSITYMKRAKEVESFDFWQRPREMLEAQICPYYMEGFCTIWDFRESMCITHFCSSVGGDKGVLFWLKLRELLLMIEITLSQYALLKLGWPVSKIMTKTLTSRDFNLEDGNGKLNEQNYKDLWGEWVNNKEELYIRCTEIIKNLDEPEFKKLTGVKGEILGAAVRETREEFINNAIPDRMILRPDVKTESIGEGKVRLSIGSSSVEVPAVILPLINGFKGKHSTVEIFHKGFKVLYNMGTVVDELRKKGILVKA